MRSEASVARKAQEPVYKKKPERKTDERTEMLQKLSSSVVDLAIAAKPQVEKRSRSESEEDSPELWARLLARKVRRMNPDTALTFQLEVDTLALKAMRE